MNPKLHLRLAAILTLIHAILHTIGGVFGKPEPGAATVAWEAMIGNPFMAMGHVRTYFAFYRGLGLGITIFLTAECVVFWLLASLVPVAGTRLRPVLGTFLVAYLALAVNSYEYFFSGPVIAEILIAAFLAAAIFTLKPVNTPAI